MFYTNQFKQAIVSAHLKKGELMFDSLRLTIAKSLVPKGPGGEPVQLKLISPTSTGGTPPRLGTRDLLEAYSQMPWLRALTSKVGKSVGSIQWVLFSTSDVSTGRAIRSRKVQRASIEERHRLIKKLHDSGSLQEIIEHPLLELLVKGNMHLLGSSVLQLVQQYIDLVGEAFLLKERNVLGAVVNLWPIPPDWIKSFPTSDTFFYQLTIGGVRIDIPINEIIAFIDPDPVNPYGRGTGIARALADELETDEFAAKHLKTFFFNDAKPSLVISGENLGPADTQRLEQRWLEKQQGFWNRFKPYFMSRKVDIKELGQSFESMQMVQLRQFERDMFIQVYGFPPEKFGIVNESKRSTIAAADLFWVKDILTPRLEFMRMVFQERLVPDFDDRIILDYVLPEIQDAEQRLTVMRAAPWAWTRNEWREQTGHDPDKEAGDVYIARINEYERPANTVMEIGRPESSTGESDNSGDAAPEQLSSTNTNIMRLEDLIMGRLDELTVEIRAKIEERSKRKN